MRTTIYAGLALVAFATNSLLCRRALGADTIDAASFSAIRLASGAGALLMIAVVRDGRALRLRGSWSSAAALFVYVVAFSFAYLELSVGTGALILFGAVQTTMMFGALRSGERPHVRAWVGIVVAIGGLLYFTTPGLDAPSPAGSLLMALAGTAWGLYSLQGRGGANPLGDTAGNFIRSLPLVAGLGLLAVPHSQASIEGVCLAVLSGALMSGVGYIVWYAALRQLKAAHAAVVQLTVPVLAAGGGVVFLSEEISMRLVLAAVLTLGGVGLALRCRETGWQGSHFPLTRPPDQVVAKARWTV